MPWLRKAASGDGHSVIVYPGLVLTDTSTLPLRMFLRHMGFDAHGWELKRNFGPREGVLDESLERVLALRKETGRKVSLVGWSLGGVYARLLASSYAPMIRNVITLGSPFSGSPRATNAWRVYEGVSGQSSHDPRRMKFVQPTPPVPTTSIFSRTDGIVSWQCSYQEPAPLAENIELTASHVGMGLNPAAWYAIADRLAQRDGRWKPFHRRGWREWVFHDPSRA